MEVSGKRIPGGSVEGGGGELPNALEREGAELLGATGAVGEADDAGTIRQLAFFIEVVQRWD